MVRHRGRLCGRRVPVVAPGAAIDVTLNAELCSAPSSGVNIYSGPPALGSVGQDHAPHYHKGETHDTRYKLPVASN